MIQQQVIFHRMFFTNFCGTGGWGCSSAHVHTALGLPLLAQTLFIWGMPDHTSQASFKHPDPRTKVRCQSSLGEVTIRTCSFRTCTSVLLFSLPQGQHGKEEKTKHHPPNQRTNQPQLPRLRQVSLAAFSLFGYKLTDQIMPSFLPFLLTDSW